MKASVFDTIARNLGTASTRRGIFRLLGGAAVAGSGVALLAGEDAEAKAKHRGKANRHGKVKDHRRVAAQGKKACPPCKTRKKGKCKKNLPDGTVCPGGMCQSGSCVAKPPPPSSTCTPPCGSNSVCQNGTCVAKPPPPPSAMCGSGGPCLVFLSSTLHTGALGGLTGADAICQGLAAGAGLPGSYKAWLSDDTSSPDSRFVRSSGPYQLVDGTTIAGNWNDLRDGKLLAPIDVTETGGGAGGSTVVWTNTKIDGTPSSGTAPCQNWTASAAGSFAGVGFTFHYDFDWTSFGPESCASLFHLYCFQQR